MKLILLFILTAQVALTSVFGGVTVVGSLARDHTVKPGDSFDGVIVVRNDGTTPVEFTAIQSDYRFTADGHNFYGKPGTHARSNAAWISISPARASIAPLSSMEVYYKGRVPVSDALAGTYWSLVMIEPVATPPPQIEGHEKKITVGLHTVMRYAVQIVTNIGATGAEQLSVLGKALLIENGQTVLQLDAANTGERVQIPQLSLDLFNADGGAVGHFEAGRRRIYPGCSARYTVKFGNLPAGKYSALAVLDSGGAYVTGAQYTLDVTR